MQPRLQPGAEKPFQVFTVADSQRDVHARGGLVLRPNFDLTDHPAIEVLIVPGGMVTEELKWHSVIEWIHRISARSELTASVCTGAFLLGKAGLLRDKRITTHWEDIDDFRAMFPDAFIESERRWVDARTVVTSAGISAGIDMSLHLVARLEGRELAVKTAKQMDYDWKQTA